MNHHHRHLLAAVALVVLIAAGGGNSASSSGSTTTDPTTTSEQADQHVFEADHFAPGAIVGAVTTEDCTLSGGTSTRCARVTISG